MSFNIANFSTPGRTLLASLSTQKTLRIKNIYLTTTEYTKADLEQPVSWWVEASKSAHAYITPSLDAASTATQPDTARLIIKLTPKPALKTKLIVRSLVVTACGVESGIETNEIVLCGIMDSTGIEVLASAVSTSVAISFAFNEASDISFETGENPDYVLHAELDRLMSCHAVGSPTTGDAQEILGEKTFKEPTTFKDTVRITTRSTSPYPSYVGFETTPDNVVALVYDSWLDVAFTDGEQYYPRISFADDGYIYVKSPIESTGGITAEWDIMSHVSVSAPKLEVLDSGNRKVKGTFSTDTSGLTLDSPLTMNKWLKVTEGVTAGGGFSSSDFTLTTPKDGDYVGSFLADNDYNAKFSTDLTIEGSLSTLETLWIQDHSIAQDVNNKDTLNIKYINGSGNAYPSNLTCNNITSTGTIKATEFEGRLPYIKPDYLPIGGITVAAMSVQASLGMQLYYETGIGFYRLGDTSKTPIFLKHSGFNGASNITSTDVAVDNGAIVVVASGLKSTTSTAGTACLIQRIQ